MVPNSNTALTGCCDEAGVSAGSHLKTSNKDTLWKIFPTGVIPKHLRSSLLPWGAPITFLRHGVPSGKEGTASPLGQVFAAWNLV